MGVDDDKRDGWRDVLRSLFTGWQSPTTHPVDDRGEGAESLIGFVVAAALVGVLTGLSAASFRLVLPRGARLLCGGVWWRWVGGGGAPPRPAGEIPPASSCNGVRGYAPAWPAGRTA